MPTLLGNQANGQRLIQKAFAKMAECQAAAVMTLHCNKTSLSCSLADNKCGLHPLQSNRSLCLLFYICAVREIKPIS
jgi:hypothetical protein